MAIDRGVLFIRECASFWHNRPQERMSMAFRLSGDVLIACNCDWGCPCNVNARPTKGFCQGGWIWMIDGGHADDVPLGGLGAAVFAKWPGAIHEGGGRATCYIDARASDAQHAALTRVLRGEL